MHRRVCVHVFVHATSETCFESTFLCSHTPLPVRRAVNSGQGSLMLHLWKPPSLSPSRSAVRASICESTSSASPGRRPSIIPSASGPCSTAFLRPRCCEYMTIEPRGRASRCSRYCHMPNVAHNDSCVSPVWLVKRSVAPRESADPYMLPCMEGHESIFEVRVVWCGVWCCMSNLSKMGTNDHSLGEQIALRSSKSLRHQSPISLLN
ncbi:hypothetical protein BDV96DRAFT_305443 [Lophiotrema nucula]|uniref:Uncharacterized protein n=1 Tax=Lophiotrema nucula TaxID=690887 RepID=A0A6A5YK53_9PLEO|nr:hypothetical protein BDV96DRAFT_305443 [Lophiotrema nucula]